MPGANVQYPLPLTRANSIYPGQFGVEGADDDDGFRVHPTGKVLYVDPNFPGAETTRDGTDPTNPLSTITAAVSKCRPYHGDVIMVGHNSSWQWAEGGRGIATAQYTIPIAEEATLSVSGVRLVGQSFSGIGVPWNPVSDGGTCLTVTGNDCIVEGFAFTEGATYTGCNGISAIWDGATTFGENLTIRNCFFDDTVATAISLNYCWFCDIHNNTFWVPTTGISATASADYALVHHNVFHECTAAISAAASDHWHIFENDFYDSGAAGGAAGINCFVLSGDNHQVARNNMSCSLGAQYSVANTPGVVNAWINNYLLDGVTTGNP